MSSYLDELIEQSYNPDGTMKPEYRQQLLSEGMDEAEIEQWELRHIRKAENAQQVQQLREEHERRGAEAEQKWEQEERQRQEERTRLGLVSSSVSTVDLGAMSQGFVEPDNFYNPADSSEEEKKGHYVFSEEELAADEEF
jgi:hypothetical protein